MISHLRKNPSSEKSVPGLLGGSKKMRSESIIIMMYY
jgi:hypothetical protein